MCGAVLVHLAGSMGYGGPFHRGGFLKRLHGIRLMVVLVQTVNRQIPIFPRGMNPLLHGGFGKDACA